MSAVFSLARMQCVRPPDSILYFERLDHFRSAGQADGRHVEARRFDCVAHTRDRSRVVEAMRLLRVCPGLRVGVNISGCSVADENLWCDALAELEADRSLAKRLVLEIDEGESVELRHGSAFISRMQWLGCKVALDHFGRRYGTETGAAIAEPDIVKIDGEFMHAAMGDSFALERLEGLIKLASTCAQHVVILGVKTAGDARLAVSVGARWAQADN